MDGRAEYTVTAEDEGLTLGQLARLRMDFSASLLRSIKRAEGGVLLDGQPVFVNVRPAPGQVISLMTDRQQAPLGAEPQPGPVDIAYEDELMLIVDKPGGLAVHPSPGHPDSTLANYVSALLAQRGGEAVFHAINRLDRGTSGLMCVAKSKHSAFILEKALEEGRLTRGYLAICEGLPDPPEGVISLPIGRAEGFGIKRRVDHESGQPAVTCYRTVSFSGGRALLALELRTGRTHQIRVHMSHIGCPLTGDFMYGQEIPGFDRVALHSCRIKISLPGRCVEIKSPLPADLAGLL